MYIPGVSFLTINSTKNHETFKVFHLTKEGWVRREGKGEGGSGGNFPLELFVRISFPFPCKRTKFLLKGEI